MKRFFFFILILFLLFNLAVGGVAAYGWHLFTKTGPLENDTILVLEKGSGLRQISRDLKEAGIIFNDLAFVFGARVEDQATLLKAGEYKFTPGLSGKSVMELLVSGKVIAHFLTIPEGLQSREVKILIESKDSLSGAVSEQIPEGTILPETYHFRRGDDRDTLVRRMKTAMTKAVDDLWKNALQNTLITSKEDLVILASIVEKETGLASERAHVAGVFLNRLRKKMRLQSDPTVSYGITLGQSALGRPLSKKDLAAVNDYNTYVVKGLPVKPISNPGLESLKAVLMPKKTKDLYFVADGKGGHTFAETLKQHNRNVRKWRKIKNKQ